MWEEKETVSWSAFRTSGIVFATISVPKVGGCGEVQFSQGAKAVGTVIAIPEKSLNACPAAAESDAPSWSGFDRAAISTSIVVAVVLRFWRLGSPSEPVYDETKVLTQAQSFLHGWRPPYSSHPPFGKLVVALSVRLFGDSPWGWRAVNALIGTALVPITYLLARRLFRSSLAASIAALLLLCEGMFLIASRLAMINIVYITTGAWAYLMLCASSMTLGLERGESSWQLWA